MYCMLFKGSKSTQVFLTQQGCILYAHTLTRYCIILLHYLTLCQVNCGAGLKYAFRKITECTVPSEITQN